MLSFGNHACIHMSWPVFMMNHQSRSAEVLFVIVKNTLQSGHSEQSEKDRKWLISKCVPLGNAGIGFASGCLYSLPPRTLISRRIMYIGSNCPAPKEKQLQKFKGIHSCFGPCVSSSPPLSHTSLPFTMTLGPPRPASALLPAVVPYHIRFLTGMLFPAMAQPVFPSICFSVQKQLDWVSSMKFLVRWSYIFSVSWHQCV